MKAALLLALALPASAASAAPPATPGMPMADVPGGKNITCTEFLKLGGEAATKVLYFVNGYAAGVADQIAAGTPPAQGGTKDKAAATASNTAGPLTSTPALNGVSLDQVHALCTAKPTATVLSLIPGGLPVTGNGTLTDTTGGTATTGAAATGTTTTDSGGGANIGATFGGAATTGASPAGGTTPATTGATGTTPSVTVPNPPTGGTSKNSSTGEVTPLPPTGGTTGTPSSTTTP